MRVIMKAFTSQARVLTGAFRRSGRAQKTRKLNKTGGDAKNSMKFGATRANPNPQMKQKRLTPRNIHPRVTWAPNREGSGMKGASGARRLRDTEP
jgi:hypothetical protein